jgi:hypothetical protein
MRKFVIPLLLASVAATPAVAGPRNHSDRDDVRAERSQAREERSQAREDRQQARQDRQQVRVERQQAPREVRQQSFTDRQQFSRPDRVVPQRADRQVRIDQRNVRTNEIRQQAQDRRVQRNEDRAAWQRDNFRGRTPVVSNTPRPGTQPPLRTEGRHSDRHWDTNWRHNSRYDWRNYRNHHRSLFHLGIYFDPFGWNYSPFQIGWRMWPSYYSNRFWFDPSMYGLPYAPPGTQWVRYYNDAILVDTWSGQVVDVLYDFFW